MAAELRLALDVNVLLDVLARREPHFASSAMVWASVEAGRAEGLIAAHSVTTLHYLLARHRDRRTATVAVSELMSVFGVAPVGARVLQEALGYGWRDFEDAVQASAALAAGATHLVTRNVTDFKGATLPVLTPAEVLPLLVDRG